MKISGLVLVALLFSGFARGEEAVSLKYTPECILQAVLAKKHQEFKPEVPMPAVYVESKTPLKQFQDAIEPQWGMRPDSFLNAYVFARNEIYLLDEARYYQQTGRFIDDSLAHELTHYVQVMYQHFDLSGGDDSLEADAIDVQTWFREEFMKTGKSPCGR